MRLYGQASIELGGFCLTGKSATKKIIAYNFLGCHQATRCGPYAQAIEQSGVRLVLKACTAKPDASR